MRIPWEQRHVPDQHEVRQSVDAEIGSTTGPPWPFSRRLLLVAEPHGLRWSGACRLTASKPVSVHRSA